MYILYIYCHRWGAVGLLLVLVFAFVACNNKEDKNAACSWLVCCFACLIDGGFIFSCPLFSLQSVLLYHGIHRQMLETDHANACICSCRAAGDGATRRCVRRAEPCPLPNLVDPAFGMDSRQQRPVDADVLVLLCQNNWLRLALPGTRVPSCP